MNQTQSELIGAKIKSEKTGQQRTIAIIVWQGTASVICGTEHRRPAAIVVDTQGDEWAVVHLAGCSREPGRWWDGRIVMSREWEGSDGELIGDTDPAMGAKIDAIFATFNDGHERAYRDLLDRVNRNMYGVAECVEI
jgi:hypothetical protein